MALTAKQEQFAKNVGLRGMNQSEAYSAAYDASKMTPESIATAASRLVADANVSSRINVLRERATAAAVKKTGYTLADAIDEADVAAREGLALGQVSATVAAVKLKAQLAGHLVEKKEIRTGALEEVDLEKLALMREQAEREIKAAEDAASVVGEVPAPPAPQRRVIG